MKILILEKDPESSKEISDILTENGYKVENAQSSKMILEELYKGKSFDLIISDFLLPDKNDIQLLKYLKSTPQLSKIPILIASSQQDKNSVIRSIELGAKDFIVKPINKEILLSKIENILNQSSKFVLVVDDDNLLLGLLQKVIERQGYKTLTANSGEEALKLIDSKKVGMVISDIEMPGMDGLELLKQIKKMDENMPVLMITGKGSKHNMYKLMDAGADGYITKPFKNFEITERVNAVMK